MNYCNLLRMHNQSVYDCICFVSFPGSSDLVITGQMANLHNNTLPEHMQIHILFRSVAIHFVIDFGVIY